MCRSARAKQKTQFNKYKNMNQIKPQAKSCKG